MSWARVRESKTLVLVLVCTAWFMVILDISVVNVALPSIRRGLHFSATELQWVVNAYTLTFAGFLLLGGRLGDLLGRRRVLLSGMALFTLSSLLGGIAQSKGMLIGARAAQGLGGAIVSPSTLSIISTTFAEGSERNRALGVWAAIGGGGGTAGVLLGGILTQALDWRWILFVNVPIGIVTIILSRRFVPESRGGGTRHYDVAGALTVTAGLAAIVFAIVRTSVNGWGSTQTIAVLLAGIALLAAFVAIEGRFAKRPLVPLRIFRSRTLIGANLVMFFLACALFSMWFFLSLYLQEVLHYKPIPAGLAFLPLTAGIMVGSTVAGRVVARTGVKAPLLIGAAVEVAGMLLFARVSPHGSFVADVLPPSLLLAAGMGATFVPVTVSAVAGVAPQDAGLASGLVNTSRQVGGSLGLAALTTIAASRTSSLLHHHVATANALTAGYHRAFFGMAIFAALGGLAALVLIKPRPRPATVTDVRPEPAAAMQAELVA